ncbi:helix-turn-helix domain-containing protein [Oceanobacillus halotolerans]|uniref:helix-turn-helix domain-containing protein n=1 Tax=Oceanobacillus halotolerans TaxID=2663380 RepID=UPI0013D99B00|nr:helix-turn-helix transcriptional regulator [Oceanobacillus halotolerans]
MEGLGLRLEKLREKDGYKRREVSIKLGYSINTYGNYENEKRRPTTETLVKLADLYDVSVDYLLRGTVSEAKATYSTNLDKAEQVLAVFEKHGMEKPYILQHEKWEMLTCEDLKEMNDHFEQVVQKAKVRSGQEPDHL